MVLFVDDFVVQLELILTDNLKSMYLLGSIALGDFRVDSSDIDFLVITEEKMTEDDLSKIDMLHSNLNDTSIWGQRIEVSYISVDTLNSDSVIGQNRPYYNSGKLSCEPYGQEWYIDKYILITKGVLIYGCSINRTIDEISVKELKCASIKFFRENLKPLIESSNNLSSEYLVFVTLSICRILYTLKEEAVTSKSESVDWLDQYTQYKYSDALNEAINWKLEKEFVRRDESIVFMTEMYNQYIGSK